MGGLSDVDPAGSSEPLLHVVLDRPRIAGNIGAIARLCAATGCALHVCGPLPFTGGPPDMRRAGVDSWGGLRLHFHLTTERCLTLLAGRPLFVVEVGEGRAPDEVSLSRGTVVVFGPEDGSVEDAVTAQATGWLTLPTTTAVRSINVAQCAAVVVYEAVRQYRAAQR